MLFAELVAANQRAAQETMSLEQYLDGCRKNPLMWASAARRLRDAIGPGVPVDKRDPRNTRLFKDENVLEYPTFEGFFGIPRTIERIVNFIDGAAQGLQQSQKILFLVGPPSTAKSSLARRLMQLMEAHPIYVLKAGDEISPRFENPLCLFANEAVRKAVSATYSIPLESLNIPISPWVFAHLRRFEGDISKFQVVRIMPSLAGSQGLAKVEPYKQYDPARPSPIIAGLSATGQGMLEFVEMFRLVPEEFNPLYSATEERQYGIPGELGIWPYNGVLIGHSNIELWTPFRDNKNNAALISRIEEIPVSYTTRISAERKIYQVHLAKGGITDEHLAPETLNVLACLGVLSRITDGVKTIPYAYVLDGEDSKVVGSTRELGIPNAKDGQTGLFPRYLYGLLANVFTANHLERRADPVTLLKIVEAALKRDHAGTTAYETLLRTEILPYYINYLGLQLQQACVEDYRNYGQSQLTHYATLVEAWDLKEGFKNPETGQLLDNDWVSGQMVNLEAKMGIKEGHVEFRQKMLRFWWAYRAAHPGEDVPWLEEASYRGLVEKLTTMEFAEIWKIADIHRNRDAKERVLHEAFVRRLCLMGYTQREVVSLVTWWIQKKLDAGEKIPETSA